MEYGEEPSEKTGKGRRLIKEQYAWLRMLKMSMGIGLFAAILFLLTGCGTGGIFDGSRVSNGSVFQLEYSVLNREESAEMELWAGDQLRVTLSHAKGYVDVTVGMDGKDPIYRGNAQQNAEFALEISAAGSYTISVSGHQAKGSVSFIRIPGGKE